MRSVAKGSITSLSDLKIPNIDEDDYILPSGGQLSHSGNSSPYLQIIDTRKPEPRKSSYPKFFPTLTIDNPEYILINNKHGVVNYHFNKPKEPKSVASRAIANNLEKAQQIELQPLNNINSTLV